MGCSVVITNASNWVNPNKGNLSERPLARNDRIKSTKNGQNVTLIPMGTLHWCDKQGKTGSCQIFAVRNKPVSIQTTRNQEFLEKRKTINLSMKWERRMNCWFSCKVTERWQTGENYYDKQTWGKKHNSCLTSGNNSLHQICPWKFCAISLFHLLHKFKVYYECTGPIKK